LPPRTDKVIDIRALQKNNLDLVAKLSPAFSKYKASIKRQPLSDHTKRAYCSRLNNFFGWVATAQGDYTDFLTSEPCRANAVRAYKSHLKQSQKASPNTVNSILTTIDHFCEFIGVEPAKVKREDLPSLAPQALSADQQRRLLESANCAKPQDKALIYLLIYTGIRVGECQALNCSDVLVSERKGEITVRDGKGGKYRKVPINGQARDSLRDWLMVRARKYKESPEAVFLNPQGQRISIVGMHKIVQKLGRRARLEVPLHPHLLRHSCLTNLVRKGHDLVLVADIAGHSRLETTRRYTLPSETDRTLAMESIEID
jgi:site-specific recombinase XerD